MACDISPVAMFFFSFYQRDNCEDGGDIKTRDMLICEDKRRIEIKCSYIEVGEHVDEVVGGFKWRVFLA